MATQKPETKSTYWYTLKTGLSKVGKIVGQANDPGRVVLVCPTNEAKTDSEETKKVVKEVLAPKTTGIQVCGLGKIQKEGIAIKTGNKTAVQKITEMAGRNITIKCTNQGG